MAVTAQRGPGMGLPLYPLVGLNNSRSLAAGEAHIIPAGQYLLLPGPYCTLQYLDPITGVWRSISTFPSAERWISSDGVNLRIVNLSGCAVGAYVTNVGSGYTSAPTITAGSTGEAYTAIVGGALNTSVTITAAGAGFNYAPQLIVQAPPAGGVPATMTCTISAGAINAVTVINQGAGYTTVPTIFVVPDPREAAATTPGPTTAATLTAALTGSGTVTAVLCTNQGTAQTSVPSLTFTGGGGSSAAATAVMAFTATGFTVGAGGAAYGNAQPFGVITIGGIVGGAAGAVVNPAISTGLFTPRQANISGTSTSGGAITATGLVVNDAGLFQAVPNGLVIAGGSGLATTVGQATITVGGTTDFYLLQPF